MKRRSRPRRIFSPELRQKVVSDIEQGKASIIAVCREYSVSTTTVYRWLHKYSTYGQKGIKVVLELASEGYRSKELEKRLKDAEAALGRKQMEVDFLEKMIEIANKELGIDIKKNHLRHPQLVPNQFARKTVQNESALRIGRHQ